MLTWVVVHRVPPLFSHVVSGFTALWHLYAPRCLIIIKKRWGSWAVSVSVQSCDLPFPHWTHKYDAHSCTEHVIQQGVSKQKWPPLLKDNGDGDEIRQFMKNPACAVVIFYIFPKFLLTYKTNHFGIKHHHIMSQWYHSNNEQSLLVTQTGGVMTWFSEEDPPLYAHEKTLIAKCFLWPCQLPVWMPAWKYCCNKTHVVWGAALRVILSKFSRTVCEK